MVNNSVRFGGPAADNHDHTEKRRRRKAQALELAMGGHVIGHGNPCKNWSTQPSDTIAGRLHEILTGAMRSSRNRQGSGHDEFLAAWLLGFKDQILRHSALMAAHRWPAVFPDAWNAVCPKNGRKGLWVEVTRFAPPRRYAPTAASD